MRRKCRLKGHSQCYHREAHFSSPNPSGPRRAQHDERNAPVSVSAAETWMSRPRLPLRRQCLPLRSAEPLLPFPPHPCSHRSKAVFKEQGPDDTLMIHCSAGVGRTGTFIAIDTYVESSPQQPSLIESLARLTLPAPTRLPNPTRLPAYPHATASCAWRRTAKLSSTPSRS